MTPQRGASLPSPWFAGAAIMLALLAVAPRFVNLGARPVMHDESLFAYYSYQAMQNWRTNGTLRGAYTHMPILHGPLLEFATALVFARLGDSMAVARGLIALSSLAMLGASLALWPRRWRWWLAPLLFTSPVLLYYSRFFRNDALFCAFLAVGTLGVARGLSRRRGHVAWSVVGAMLLLGLLTIMENAIFVYAAGATFGALVALLKLLRRARRDWYRALLRLRPPAVRHPLAPIMERRSTKRKKKARESYLEPSFAAVVGEEPENATPPESWAATFHSSAALRPLPRWLPSMLGWVGGALCGLALIALLFGYLAGQAPVTGMEPSSPLKAWLARLARALGWANMLASWQYWSGQHQEQRIAGPLYYHLPILLTYELPLLLLVYAGTAWDALLRRGRALLYAGTLATWLVLWQLWRLAYPAASGWFRPPAGEPTPWLGPINKVAHFLHVAPDLSMLTLGLLIAPLLVWSVLKLLEHRPLAAWMGWWTACSLFQYSSAGEKVPWLAMHIALPFYLMLGWVWAPLLRHRRARVQAALAALALTGALVGLRSDLRFLGNAAADPRERIVFNHTTARVDVAIKNRLATWEEFAKQAPLAQRRVLLVDDPQIGGPSWPGFWYFRRCAYQFTTAPGQMLRQQWDLVLGTQQTLQPWLGTLDRERWNAEEMSLRDHWWAPWPEENRWRAWLTGQADPLGKHPPLRELLADSVRLWWRYYWYRETWTDPGHYPIILLDPQQARRQ